MAIKQNQMEFKSETAAVMVVCRSLCCSKSKSNQTFCPSVVPGIEYMLKCLEVCYQHKDADRNSNKTRAWNLSCGIRSGIDLQ